MMLAHTRLHRIQALLSTQQQLSTEQLILEFGVSRETIRRDIITLESQNLVKRVHGGIIAINPTTVEAPFSERQTTRTKEKKIIATYLSNRLTSGQTLFIDSGSTTTHLAEALRTMSGLTILTNSLQVVMQLSAVEEHTTLKNDVFLLGGQIEAHAKETRGAQTLNAIYQHRADMAILSPVGVSEQGVSSFYPWESAIAEAMIRQSASTTLLVDHSKLGVQSRCHYATPEQIHLMITDPAAAELPHFSTIASCYPQLVIAGE